ncbi:MAG: hypothetical protein IT364_16635 [Candidatus Hydrogenedentes bacterium]|nr:hypothetical protein [Candidatus Hydrogenedentota bacterium]
MSRRYDRITLAGKIEFTEDFASRATQERGIPISLDLPLTIDDQQDPLLLALLQRQRKIDEDAAMRWYAQNQSMILSTF